MAEVWERLLISVRSYTAFLSAFPWDSQSARITCTVPVTVPHFGALGPVAFYLCVFIDVVVDGKAAVRKVLESFV